MSNERAAACIRNQARIDYGLFKIKQEEVELGWSHNG